MTTTTATTPATGNAPPIITRSENEQLTIDIERDSVKNRAYHAVREDISFTFISQYAKQAAQHAVSAAAAANDAGNHRDRLPVGSPEYTAADAYAAVSRNAANNAQDASAAVTALQEKAKEAQRQGSNRSVFSASSVSYDAARYACIAYHERTAAEIAAARAANPDTEQPEAPGKQETK